MPPFPSQQRRWTPLLLVLLVAVLSAMLFVTSSDALPSVHSAGGHAPGHTTSTPPTSRSPAGGNGSGRQHPVRHHHGQHRANGRGPSGPQPSVPTHYPIVRPGRCVDDVPFADCFLCGKVAEDPRVYHDCCNGDLEIIHFCNRLLY